MAASLGGALGLVLSGAVFAALLHLLAAGSVIAALDFLTVLFLPERLPRAPQPGEQSSVRVDHR